VTVPRDDLVRLRVEGTILAAVARLGGMTGSMTDVTATEKKLGEMTEIMTSATTTGIVTEITLIAGRIVRGTDHFIARFRLSKYKGRGPGLVWWRWRKTDFFLYAKKNALKNYWFPFS